MTRAELAAGLGLIETVTGLKPSEELTAAWWELARGLTDEQWTAAVRRYLGGLVDRPREFPMPGQVLGLAAQCPTDEPLALEADRAWTALLRCADYTPEAGTYWSAARVRRELGEAVHRAAIEAGGYQQLRILDDAGEFWARKRFVEAYRQQRETLPALGPATPETRFALPERTGDPAVPLAARTRETPRLSAGEMPRARAVVVEATDERKRQLIEALGVEGTT